MNVLTINRRWLLAALLCLAAVAGLVLTLSARSDARPTKERTYKLLDKDFPKDVVEVKEVRNLQSAIFPKDLEVELKNISGKPIYFISMALILPNAKINGIPLIFRLDHGDSRLVDNSELAGSKDVPISPQQSFVLKVNELQARGLQQFIAKGDLAASALDRVLFHLQIINFGDGTGFIGKDAYPARKAKVSGGQRHSAVSVVPAAWAPGSYARRPVLCNNWKQKEGITCYALQFCRPRVAQLDASSPRKEICVFQTICYDPEGGGYIPCPDDMLFSCDSGCYLDVGI